ncbi:MAG TPA: helix-turn-helix domain-containing protein [Gaiellaceae bacterium]
MEDRLRNIIDVLVDIDDPAAGAELARRAHLSRFHFDRLSAAILGESPAAFRRRLLLERAAYELTRGASATDAAFGAGYASLEAFTRAFRRAYGVAPSRFAGDFKADAPNGIHFHPPGGLLVPGNERRQTMDLTTRLVEHDNWLAEQLIDAASTLDDTALDEPVPVSPPTDSFAEESPSIRSMLNRLVFTKEMWSAAIGGREFVEATDTSLPALRERLGRAGWEFATLVSDVARRDAWDTAFVDATCDPPVSFTFGAAVAHVLTRDSYRRQVVAAALRERGIDVAADPIAWERKGD